MQTALGAMWLFTLRLGGWHIKLTRPVCVTQPSESAWAISEPHFLGDAPEHSNQEIHPSDTACNRQSQKISLRESLAIQWVTTLLGDWNMLINNTRSAAQRPLPAPPQIT